MKRVLAFVFLSACAPTVPLVRPVAVQVPVSAPCPASEIKAPRWPVQGLPGNAAGFEVLRALMVENELRKSYEIRLVAELEACRK